MRGTLVVLMILVFGACSPAMTRRMNVAALITSTALLACDGAQTAKMAGEKWRTTWERNPVMGATPDTTTVGVYFASAVLINAAVWAVLPERYRAVLPAAVTGVEARTIADNAARTGWCGLD